MDLLELFKATLTTPLHPWTSFESAARRPAPGFGALCLNVAAFAAAFFALNLWHATISYPGILGGYPAGRFALVGSIALSAAVLGSFLVAATLHAVARAAGGAAPFSRSYQAVSMLGALLPLQAAVLWYPPLAIAPALALAALCAAAIEKLHHAPPIAARSLLAFLAAFSLFLGWAVL